MLAKALLTTRIGEAMKRRRLTVFEAAEIVGMPQPKVSGPLRGLFRGIGLTSRTRSASCVVNAVCS
jgi:hypothetical protein